MLRLLTSSLLMTLSAASYCGDSSIPFSLEVLHDGQPVLGCARPTCFGWAPSGNPVTNTGAFYRINDHVDGFIRPGPLNSIPAYGPTDSRYYVPQTAVCEPTPSSLGCPAVNQWVGGIAPLLNVTQFPTMMQCCSYDGLQKSEDRGMASLHGGQTVIGGEVVSSGVQVAFDYISNVVKVVRADGTVQYDVSVRRMPCAELSQTDGSNKIQKDGAAQAFQAPILPVDQPLHLPQGPVGPTGPENLVLEEIVQEEAIQLPPGTQFQPVLQPPPPQPQPIPFQPQFVPQAAPAPYYSYAPVAYGGGGGAQWCFAGDMTVQMIDGSSKRMDELQKMDWVLAVNGANVEFVPVEFWLHRVPDQVAEFNEFETENGKTIKLTDKHYIFKGDCSRVGAGPITHHMLPHTAVFAEQVHVGDCLYTLANSEYDMHEVRVVRARKVTQTGIYAPMTSNGKIIVNGVHASCHNIMQAHSMGYSAFGYIDLIKQAFDNLFGVDPNAVIETPTGLSTILAISDLVLPKNLAIM